MIEFLIKTKRYGVIWVTPYKQVGCGWWFYTDAAGHNHRDFIKSSDIIRTRVKDSRDILAAMLREYRSESRKPHPNRDIITTLTRFIVKTRTIRFSYNKLL